MTTYELQMDWLRNLADATSWPHAVGRMKTETLEIVAAAIPGSQTEKMDPKGCRTILRHVRDELARRATWDGYVDTEGLPS